MLDLSAGSELAGYRIEALAGQGGMGVVYMATDLTLDRPVALKVISDELAGDVTFRERFKRESRLAASIRHPNVITVFRAGEENGRLYIAMEFIEGTDLKTLIAGRGRLEPLLAASIVSQVAAALDAAHAKTLVHRDVKPANVLIDGDRESCHAYLTDFGLTKHTSSQTAMTDTGMVVGTLDYMAPEQIEGAPVDARSDIYSLGCVLYEALTGQVPYPKESNVAKMYAHASDPPPSVIAAAPDTPPAFEAIVSRAMAKDREERYLSAGDLGQAASAAAEDRSIAVAERSVATGEAAPREAGATVPAAAAGAPPTRLAVPRRKRPLVLGAAAILVAVVVAVVLLAGSGDGGSASLSRDEYQDRVLDATRPFNAQAVSLENRLPADLSNRRDALRAATALASFRGTTDRVIARLDGLTPPEDVKDLHARVLAGFRRFRAVIADAGAAADSSNDRVYQAVPGKLNAEARALDSLAPRFEARGYRRLSF